VIKDRVRFWLGLLIGAVVGAGVTWLGLERPWRRAAAPVVQAAIDAGPTVAKPTKKKRGRRRGQGGSGGGGGGGGFEEEAEALEPPPPTLSAADREMAWRGPPIKLPPRSLDLGSGDDARPLQGGEINDVVASSSGPILDCIEEARAGALLSGEVRLEMLVGGGGSPSKVRIGAPRWLIAHGLADCAMSAARRMRFPATGAPTVVDVPYHID
jgi:hypothetical protein